MAKPTTKDLTQRILELVPQIKEGDTNLGYPYVEASQGGITYTVPIKEYTQSNNHLTGGSA